MPLVLLEAAASGLPIVATDVGGNREVAIEDSNGLLAPARDPAALARRMMELLALPAEERRAMGTRGREYVVTTYDLESVIQTWEGIYTGWLRRKGVALV
jgi:glycosyltransferase involved in cell wall biosynthesis